MTNPRLIKRTTTTEEFFDDGACPAPRIDDNENDAIPDGDDDDAIEAPRAARGQSQDDASVSGAETAGTDDADLAGQGEE